MQITAHAGAHALRLVCACMRRGSIIAIDDAAPRREDGFPPGSYVRPASAAADSSQHFSPSHHMDHMDAMAMEAANGDESMGPARRHPDERIRNGYKPY